MKKSELKEIIKSEFLTEKKDSKKGNENEQKRMEGAIRDDRDHIKNLKKDIEANEKKLARLKKDYKRDVVKEEMEDDMDEMMRGDEVEEMRGGATYEEDDIKAEGAINDENFEDQRGTADQKLWVIAKLEEAGIISSSEKKAALTAVGHPGGMNEAEEVDVEDNVDVDVDVEDDIEIDDVSDKSEIEVDSELAGEDADVSAILGLLTKAQANAKDLGDEKLMDQIGNTITYYTRAHVVSEMEDEEGMREEMEDDVKEEMKDDKKEELNEEVARFKKLAGLIK